MRRFTVLLACAALVSGEQPAAADVASEARFFDELGRHAYNAGEYGKALEAFQLVQEIAPSPRLLYNIALCAELAGRVDMAFTLYGEYLKDADTDTARRAEAKRRTALLKEKLALVEIQSQPPGVVVYVDRKELGAFGITPTTLALTEGEHRVLLERAGFAPNSTSVIAKTAAVTQVSVALEPLFGELTVNVTPSSARLRFLQGEVAVPFGVEQSRYRLPVGQYRVVVSAPGYAPGETIARVREHEVGELDLGLVPLTHATGRLLVDTGKPGAEVFVDGRRIAVTPATLSEVSVGERLVEVRSGSRAARRRATIVEGRALYLRIDLPRP
jgi:outer membrane receptor for ferrienterochelin and colicins